MEAMELRIGNWVNYEQTYHKVTGIKGDILYTRWCRQTNDEDDYRDFVKNHKPIELTPDILEAVGFTKSTSEDVYEREVWSIQVSNTTSLYFDPHKDWMRNDYEVEWYLSHEWNNNHFKNDFWHTPKYLHQLQNLYFALTGTELEGCDKFQIFKK